MMDRRADGLHAGVQPSMKQDDIDGRQHPHHRPTARRGRGAPGQGNTKAAKKA
jgi:hypothetical protein